MINYSISQLFRRSNYCNDMVSIFCMRTLFHSDERVSVIRTNDIILATFGIRLMVISAAKQLANIFDYKKKKRFSIVAILLYCQGVKDTLKCAMAVMYGLLST